MVNVEFGQLYSSCPMQLKSLTETIKFLNNVANGQSLSCNEDLNCKKMSKMWYHPFNSEFYWAAWWLAFFWFFWNFSLVTKKWLNQSKAEGRVENWFLFCQKELHRPQLHMESAKE